MAESNTEYDCCADCDFIKKSFMPMAVDDRCFCDPESREFVELDSVTVEHFDHCLEFSTYYARREFFFHLSTCAKIYLVTTGIRFSDVMNRFALIVKIHTRTTPPFDGFLNEVMFYNKIMWYFGTDITPRSYVADMGNYGVPVVVQDDLAARGYRLLARLPNRLNDKHLRLCVKVLAKFHARGMKLRANEPSIFEDFCVSLWSSPKLNTENLFQQLVNKHETIEISEDARSNVLDLLGKVRRKMQELDHLTDQITDVSTICHGHFLGDNVWIRDDKDGEPEDARIIDWEHLRFSTPAIDFGTVLIANLPNETDEPLETFFQNNLRLYIDVVRTEYPDVNYELLEKDIIAKLLSGYFISQYLLTKDGGSLWYFRSLRIFRLLDRLGSLD